MPLPDEVVQITDAFLAAADGECPGLIDGLLLHGSLCWGEFFAESDVDFVGIIARDPASAELDGLAAAHDRVREEFSGCRLEGFYCQRASLAVSSADAPSVPVHHEGFFDRAGNLDVNPVTWHELAERGIVVRGELPEIHTDHVALLAYSRANLQTYWAPLLARIDTMGAAKVGAHDGSVVWVTLGVSRLHHLLARGELTSKSGAGRYILDALEPRWHRLAHDALAIREEPGSASNYDDPAERGVDVREFLAWTIEDGFRLP